MKINKIAFSLLLVLCIATMASCAPNGYESEKSGFFSGVWHGIIIVFSLIGKLFDRDIGIYAEHNTGFLYWLGFIIGIGAFGGGSNSARR